MWFSVRNLSFLISASIRLPKILLTPCVRILLPPLARVYDTWFWGHIHGSYRTTCTFPFRAHGPRRRSLALLEFRQLKSHEPPWIGSITRTGATIYSLVEATVGFRTAVPQHFQPQLQAPTLQVRQKLILFSLWWLLLLPPLSSSTSPTNFICHCWFWVIPTPKDGNIPVPRCEVGLLAFV